MDRTYLLSLINPAISSIFCATFFFLWNARKEKSYILNWSLAFAASSVASFVDFARVFVADATLISFTTNVFLLLFAFFAVRGSTLRYSGGPKERHLLLVSGITIVVSIWFTFLHPSVTLRGVSVSAGSIVLFMLAVVQIRRNKHLDRIDRFIAQVFSMTALFLVLRPITSLIYEGSLTSENQLPSSFWITSFKVLAIFAWVSLAVSFLARIATDLMQELAEQSITDALSGVLNRRGFFATAEPAVAKASAALPVAVLICDIDHFKKINDAYGHKVGDTVIQGLANILHSAAGESGIVGRLGGEEFAVVLPNTDVHAALVFAEGVRTGFAYQPHEGVAPSRRATVSIGLAESCGGESLDTLLERADAALYRAKANGRDRVESSFQDQRDLPRSSAA